MPHVASEATHHAYKANAAEPRSAKKSASASASPFSMFLDTGDQDAPPPKQTQTPQSKDEAASGNKPKNAAAKSCNSAKQAANAPDADQASTDSAASAAATLQTAANTGKGRIAGDTKACTQATATDGKPADDASAKDQPAATPGGDAKSDAATIAEQPPVAPAVIAIPTNGVTDDVATQGTDAGNPQIKPVQQPAVAAGEADAVPALSQAASAAAETVTLATAKPVKRAILGSAQVNSNADTKTPAPSADAPQTDDGDVADAAAQPQNDRSTLAADGDKTGGQAHEASSQSARRLTADAATTPATDGRVTMRTPADGTVQNSANPSSFEMAAASAQTPAAANAANAAQAQNGPQAVTVPVSGVAVAIASRALAGKNRFEIRLDPPELGRIEVRLDVARDGRVTTHIAADRPDTLNLLQRDASGLERALQDAGLKTADNGLQFSLRDQGTGSNQTASQPSATAHVVVQDDQLAPTETNSRSYARLAGLGGGVDIRV